jgi:hypothetical protein
VVINQSAKIITPLILIIDDRKRAKPSNIFARMINDIFFHKLAFNILFAFLIESIIERFSLAMIGSAKWKTNI